jgi:hypothetical protein
LSLLRPKNRKKDLNFMDANLGSIGGTWLNTRLRERRWLENVHSKKARWAN